MKYRFFDKNFDKILILYLLDLFSFFFVFQKGKKDNSKKKTFNERKKQKILKKETIENKFILFDIFTDNIII
jgi:hypothetical protein